MGTTRAGRAARWLFRACGTGGLAVLLAPAAGSALPAAPTHYAVTARTPATMTLTGLLSVDGATATAGTEVAVYTPGGVLCGASGVDAPNGGAFILHVYGDDPTTAAVEGMAAGEALRFEVWSPAGSVVHGQAALRFTPAGFGTAPPAYPPVYADRAAYSLKITTNHPPVLAAIGPKAVNENQLLSFVVSATDPDGDALTYAMTGSTLPAGATFNPAARTFSWTPGYSDAGTYSATFTVSDGMLSTQETVAFTVVNVNRAPVLAAIGPKTVAENAPLSFTVSATDADGDLLTYSASPLPAGATFTPATRAFSWTPTYAQAGSYTVTFAATDGAATASEAVTITVTNTNRAPVAAAGALSTAEDTPVAGTLSATDADGDALTYTLTAAPAPTRGTATITNASTGAYTYTPNPDANGTDTFGFQASDGVALSNAATVTVTITPVNDPPALAAIGNKAVDEGQLLTFTVTAVDPEGDALTYSASGLPAGATFTPATRTFAWTPGFTQAGNFPVTFTVTDNGTPPAASSETITISVGPVNQPPVLAAIGPKSVVEGQALTFTLSATDPNLDPLTYAAAGLPAGAAFDPSTRAFSWTPKYGQEGSYAVAFTVTDGGTPALADAETVTLTVNPAIVTVAIPLQAGWNLISWPLATCIYAGATPPAAALPQGVTCQSTASIGDVFADIAGQYERVESFDSAGAHVYDPNLPAYLSDLTYVAGGYGYRIKMKQASSLTLTGRRMPPASTLALPTGWVLAGYWGPDVRHTGAQPPVAFPAGVSFTPVAAISDVFPALAGTLQAVWSADALGDHTYAPGGPASASPVTYVGPGYGYWLKVSAPGPLSYDLP